MTGVDRAWFKGCLEEYERAAAGGEFPIDWSAVHPCDDREGGAVIDPHYVACDLWAASEVFQSADLFHVDVGSRVDGFVTHLLAGCCDVVHVDIRPPAFSWPGFTFREDDARTLSTFADASVTSLSCLHAAEHAGLGRYGDAIDAEGMHKVMRSLARVLAPGGRLYFAVPVGRTRVCFNAHRVARASWVCETFANHGLTLESFAAVDDAGRFHAEARPADFEGASYACGMFLFTRPSAT